MKYNINWNLFEGTKHGPAFVELQKAAGKQAVYDYSVPVNTYFMSGKVLENFYAELPTYLKYYPSSNDSISRKLSEYLKIDPATLVMANGSTELITWIDHLFVKDSILTSAPTFGRWTDQPVSTGKRLEFYFRKKENNFSINLKEFVQQVKSTKVKSIVICNPNNPTGQMLKKDELLYLLEELKHLELFIVDESFIDFSLENEIPTIATEVEKYPNLIVLKSLGKSIGLHGVRLGYAVSSQERQNKLKAALPPWNVNGLGVLLVDLLVKYSIEFELSRKKTVQDRIQFEKSLKETGLIHFYPSFSNFMFIEAESAEEGFTLRNMLLENHGILIRECANKIGATSQHMRVASRPVSEQTYFLKALQATLHKIRKVDSLESIAI